MKGTYLLCIKLEKTKYITIGKQGKQLFKKGTYVYVGSALNGLEHRIRRHFRKQKKLHWHIDYLLKHGEIVRVYYQESTTRIECVIAQKLCKFLECVPHFGCSDCRCLSHLFTGSDDEIQQVVRSLDMSIFCWDAKS